MAWKNFSGIGGSINGGFFILLLLLLLLLVVVSSVSEIRNTLDVELIDRCKYVSCDGDVDAELVICVAER